MKNIGKLEKMCEHISSREILSAKAERDSIKYKQVEYLEDKVGSVFDGVVSGITDWGMYIELIDNKCEGMIRYVKGMKVDSENYCIETLTGEQIRLGDIIKIKVTGVDVEKRQIDFELFQ